MERIQKALDQAAQQRKAKRAQSGADQQHRGDAETKTAGNGIIAPPGHGSTSELYHVEYTQTKVVDIPQEVFLRNRIISAVPQQGHGSP